MNTHEYQAKKILQKYGIPVPPFRVVSSLREVQNAIDDLGVSEAVIKVQVHAGGRGKAGGVKLAKLQSKFINMQNSFWACGLSITRQEKKE